MSVEMTYLLSFKANPDFRLNKNKVAFKTIDNVDNNIILNTELIDTLNLKTSVP